MSTREATLKIRIGTNGTGKSTWMKKYLQVNERNIVIPSSPDDTAWHGLPELKWTVIQELDQFSGRMVPRVHFPDMANFTGTRVVQHKGDLRIFNGIIDSTHGFKNGGLFLDDFKMYVYSKGTITKEANALFIGRRHRMLDIFMACHSANDISADFIRFNPELIVGYTTLPANDNTLAKMPNGGLYQQTEERVQATNLKQPEGKRFYAERVPTT
jgi:hypothetical protein